MPATYDDTRGPGKMPGWRKIDNFDRPDYEKVNIWINTASSGMPLSDSWEVPEAWRDHNRWFHVHNGRPMEIHSHMVTHWRPVRDTGHPVERLPSTATACDHLYRTSEPKKGVCIYCGYVSVIPHAARGIRLLWRR